MNKRAQVSWRRSAAFLIAGLLHAGLLWLVLDSTINRSPPLPSDSVEVAIVPPAPPPKPPPRAPKAIATKPAVRAAETNASQARPSLQAVPRLVRIQAPAPLTPPDPLLPKPPMSLPAASGAAAAGAPGNGSGANGDGNGAQEGNDYLKRLKAYIDSHKGGARHRTPHDADIALALDPDGMLSDAHIVTSSGDPSVDEEIIAQLRTMSPFPKPPPILFSASKPILSVVDKWIFPRP